MWVQTNIVDTKKNKNKIFSSILLKVNCIYTKQIIAKQPFFKINNSNTSFDAATYAI